MSEFHLLQGNIKQEIVFNDFSRSHLIPANNILYLESLTFFLSVTRKSQFILFNTNACSARKKKKQAFFDTKPYRKRGRGLKTNSLVIILKTLAQTSSKFGIMSRGKKNHHTFLAFVFLIVCQICSIGGNDKIAYTRLSHA